MRCSMSPKLLSGGCQCGAVRYRIEEGLGRASICHCRMCQKAFGNAFAPLVTARGLTWTRGAPSYFQSSNKVRRGFCRDCGTPLCYEVSAGEPEIAIGSLDDPNQVAPQIQVGLEARLVWCASLPQLPGRSAEEAARLRPFFEGLVSYQHPDREDRET